MRNLRNLILCVVMLVLLTAATAAAVEYEIVHLGTLDGTYNQALGINNSGQVVGGFLHGFRATCHSIVNSSFLQKDL